MTIHSFHWPHLNNGCPSVFLQLSFSLNERNVSKWVASRISFQPSLDQTNYPQKVENLTSFFDQTDRRGTENFTICSVRNTYFWSEQSCRSSLCSVCPALHLVSWNIYLQIHQSLCSEIKCPYRLDGVPAMIPACLTDTLQLVRKHWSHICLQTLEFYSIWHLSQLTSCHLSWYSDVVVVEEVNIIQMVIGRGEYTQKFQTKGGFTPNTKSTTILAWWLWRSHLNCLCYLNYKWNPPLCSVHPVRDLRWIKNLIMHLM